MKNHPSVLRMIVHLYLTLIVVLAYGDTVNNNGGPLLLYSTSKDIRMVNTTRSKVKSALLVKNLTDVVALDYHYGLRKICWTDRGLETIQCVDIDSALSEDKVEVISTGVPQPDGLACDWLTNKLYWTDSDTNRIEVASMKDYHRKVLFWSDMDEPRAIALDPLKGLMFWTDWGEVPKIERAGMNGDPSTRQVIVSDDIFWPNGITIDYELKTIYWIDGKNVFLKRMDYNGHNVSIIIKSGLLYPFALTQYHMKLYWTDWKTGAIYLYDRNATKEHREPKVYLHSDSMPVDIQVWDPVRQPYASHKCEITNGGCSHLCLLSPVPPYYSCACPIGIKLINNTTCADGPQEMLLFARRTEMCVIYLDSPDYTYRTLNLTNMKFSIAVDYDPIDGYIYWTDTSVKKIQKARLDGSEQSDVLSYEIDSSDGIAIDWIARNIYWTDPGLDRIEVATLDGKYRKVIVNEGLLNPRAIAVAPNLGWLFWSDWHEKSPKIERSNLDGTERTVIVSENLGWANGIALDLDNLKIYWCDAKNDVIEFSNVDGTDRRILLSDNIPHPFGFTLMGNYLYWTDWQRRTISRVHKETGDGREIIIEQISNIMGLKAINSQYKQTNGSVNPCGRNNGGCKQICLYNYNQSYSCVCQIGFELHSDGRTCVIPEAFLLYTKKDSLGRISIENNNNEIHLPVSGIKYASSVDYDIYNERIYWTDVKQHSIMRAYTNGSDPQRVVELGLLSPEGVAVDWVALNVYWTDPPAHRIEVARLDGSSRRVLAWRDSNVEPHSIALHPQKGRMYWTEWTLANNQNVLNGIKKAGMDGSNSKMLIVTAGYATGLTLDYEKKRLYWAETNTPAILSCDLNGLSKIVLVKEGLFRPVGLTLHKDSVYWADEVIDKRGEILRTDKQFGNNTEKIYTLDEPLTDLLVIPNAQQKKAFNQCAVNNGGCSHLCLALPPHSPNGTTSYTCACPTHYVLQNNTCTPPKRFMIYSHKNLAVRLLPDTSECLEAVLPIQGLKNVKAIDFDPVLHFLYWIEGKARSIKRAKAVGTHGTVVIMGHSGVSPFDIAIDALGRLLFWSCSVQDVINVTRIENSSSVGVIVKEAGEKPRLISIHSTKRLLIYTDVGSTPQILRRKMDGTQKVLITKGANIAAIAIDIENDMVVWAQGNSIYMSNIDGEDKQHVVLNDNNSKIGQLTVYSGWLYWVDRDNLQRMELRIGGTASVVTERDLNMLDLISVMEPEAEHPCSQIRVQKCSHLCILNGINAQCACPHGLALHDDRKTCAALPDCGEDFFTCSTQAAGGKDCIPSSWKCDGQVDCQDSSDERGCPACSRDQFRCQNGDCIDSAFVCDDIAQCKDKSDEAHCCKHPDEFQCPGTNVCIPVTSLCDGTEQCADGEDERKSVCSETSHFSGNSSGLKSLFYIILWLVIVKLIVAAIFGCYYYVKRILCNANANGPDQSEDPLNPEHIRGQIKSQKLRNKAIPDLVHMSMLNGSEVSGYDRDHITGASSSTNGSSITCYPRETLNPPPSPATTAASTRASSPTARYRPYKHYKTINQPPPPTPCSTDVCDESDYNYPTQCNRNRYDERNRYDIGPFPPPPTPRSHCNSESCPPSPSSRSSTYFSPLPPPPSPVASPPRSYNS